MESNNKGSDTGGNYVDEKEFIVFENSYKM
jgi:hypothetical protein